MNSRFLDTVRQRVLLFDGAMGTGLQERNLGPEDFGGQRWEGCNDYLSITRPDVVDDLHSAYFDAGADCVETNSFQAARLRLEEWDLGDQTYDINKAAAAIARRVADRYEEKDGRPRFVVGSMGPSGMLPSSEDPDLGKYTLEDLIPAFEVQARGLVDGGSDVLILETCQDILEMKAQILACREAFEATGKQLPLMSSVTLDPSGRMLLGTDIAGALATLEAMKVDIIGLNCSTGPDLMRDAIRYLSQNASTPIHCIPNAGLPINDGGRTLYPMKADPMAETLREFVVEQGVNIVGGCCGTTPAHIRALSAAIGENREPVKRAGRTGWFMSSAMTATSLTQEPAPHLIGERLNTQGSRKIKRLALENDIDAMIPVARTQMEGGAHSLDVCMALTERTDEAAQMRALVKKLSLSVEAPLVIDSTEAARHRGGAQGLPRLRAHQLDQHGERARAHRCNVMPLVQTYGAAVIALTIDEVGMAKTADRKLEIAKRIHDIVTKEYGLPPQFLVFDDLTFTLATGEEEFLDSAIETIEGIRKIKQELPGVLTSLGVSNVSFGLTPESRAVLNSVFLYHCVQAGLDMAIVNPAHVRPYAEIAEDDRKVAEDLIYNRDPQALATFIEHFEGRTAADREKEEEAEEASMTVEEKIHYQILHRKPAGIETLIDQAVQNQDAVEVLNTVLLPAMKEVGDKFGAGELILPFVLQSAEVMKKAVAQLENYLEKKDDTSKGRVVLATVYGDVHDIGKNLVKTILSNNGYTVFDLGKQTPVQTIIDKAKEVDATAIGLSALLVSTSKQMPICVSELQRAGLNYPVLIGGAAINRNFGRRAALVDGETFYEPGVFYCKDAFEGLDMVNLLTSMPDKAPAAIEKVRKEAFEFKEKSEEHEKRAQAASAGQQDFKVTVSRDVDIPAPPFWGPRVTPTREIPFDGMYAGMDLKTLYRLHWGGRGSGEAFDKLVREEFEPKRLQLQKEAEAEGLAASDSRVRLLPVPERGPGPRDLRPGCVQREVADAARQDRRDRAFQLPAPAGARRPVPVRLLHARRQQQVRRDRVPGGDRRPRRRHAEGDARQARRVRGLAVHPRPERGRGGRSRRVAPRQDPQGARDRRRARPALLARLQRVPGSRRPGPVLQAARPRGDDRRDADRGVPARAGGIDECTRGASPGGDVLHGEGVGRAGRSSTVATIDRRRPVMRSFSRMMLFAVAVGACAMFAAGSAKAQASGSTSTLITGARIFDGVGAELIEGRDVLIRDGLIAAIGENLDAPADATVIDANGRFMMPGLADMHAHLMFQMPFGAAFNADREYWAYVASTVGEQYLMQGFTVLRDVGGNSFSLKRAIDEGILVGPRVYPSGPMISQTSGHSDHRTGAHEPATIKYEPSIPMKYFHVAVADGREEVLRTVREVLLRRASQIKISVGGGTGSFADPLDTTQYTDDEIRAAVEAAEDWNTYVTAHVYNSDGIIRAVENGVKCIEHGNLMTKEAMRAMMKHDAWLSPQVIVYTYHPGGYNDEQKAKHDEAFEGIDQMFTMAREMGFENIVFGTDIITSREELARANEEFTLRTKWFDNVEILRQATSKAGELLALSGPRNPYPGKIGVIEEGAHADLLLIDGNPLEDMSVMTEYEERFDLIMKGGKIYKDQME